MSFVEQAAEAKAAVEAMDSAEANSVSRLLSLTKSLGSINRSEPIRITDTIRTDSGVVTATAISPASAQGGVVKIGTTASDGSASEVSLVVPVSILIQALGDSSDGLPMLTVGVMNEDLAEQLKAAGQAQSEDGEVGPTLQTKPVSIKLYYANGSEMKNVKLADPLTLTIRALESDNYDDLKCAYWDEDLLAWSGEGVERDFDTHGAANGTLACKTYHLTIFGAILGEFKKILEDAAQALVCSNAKALFSEEGLVALVKDTGWWYSVPSLVLWIAVFISAICMGICGMTDRCDGKKSPLDERLMVHRTSLSSESLGKSASISQAQKRSRVHSTVGVTVQRSRTGLESSGRTGIWVWQEMTGMNFDFSAFLKDIRDAPTGLVNRCVSLLHARKANIDSEGLESLLKLRQEFPTESVVPQLRRSITHLTGDKDLVESGREAANTFFSRCWCVRVAHLFAALQPVLALFRISLKLSRSARLALIVSKLFASAAAAALFFQASGGALADGVDPDCIPRDSLITEIVQAVVVGLACGIIGDGGVVILGIFHSDRLWRRRCRCVRGILFWLFWLLEMIGCIFFMALFLANVHQASRDDWLNSTLVSLAEEMVLMPLAIATFLALITSGILCCRPKIAQKVRSRWEDQPEQEPDPDPAQELAHQLASFDDESDVAIGMPESVPSSPEANTPTPNSPRSPSSLAARKWIDAKLASPAPVSSEESAEAQSQGSSVSEADAIIEEFIAEEGEKKS